MTGVNYKSISGILLRFKRNNNRCILGRRRNGIRCVFTEEQEAFLLDLSALRSFGIKQRCALFRARFGKLLGECTLRKFYHANKVKWGKPERVYNTALARQAELDQQRKIFAKQLTVLQASGARIIYVDESTFSAQ